MAELSKACSGLEIDSVRHHPFGCGSQTAHEAGGPHRMGSTPRSVKVPFVGVLCLAFVTVALLVGWLTIRDIASIRAELVAERDGYRDRMLENLRAMSDIESDNIRLVELAIANRQHLDATMMLHLNAKELTSPELSSTEKAELFVRLVEDLVRSADAQNVE